MDYFFKYVECFLNRLVIVGKFNGRLSFKIVFINRVIFRYETGKCKAGIFYIV